MTKNYLGYSSADQQSSPYKEFYDTNLKPVQQQVADAIIIGSQAAELFPSIDAAPSMMEPGYWPIETGYARGKDASVSIFCLTHMPRVQPKMWDWWFGWHGCESQRYKLWHPRAHVDARWQDGSNDESYIGRTSLITEFLGSDLKKITISFLRPSEIGFDEARLELQGEVVVCARIGLPRSPLKGGWLLHQLRPTKEGCEMRSRMWMGGSNAGIGNQLGTISRWLVNAGRPFMGLLLPQPDELLIHNAQEMAHLAGFLPELYAKFGYQRKT